MLLANTTSSVSGDNVSEERAESVRIETLACGFAAAPVPSFFQVALLPVLNIIDPKMGFGPKPVVSGQDLQLRQNYSLLTASRSSAWLR
jgi:hypothetical protein